MAQIEYKKKSRSALNCKNIFSENANCVQINIIVQKYKFTYKRYFSCDLT